MGIEDLHDNGVLKAVEGSALLTPGKRYHALSEEDLNWLQAAQASFDLWENDADTVYDDL